MHPSNDFRLTPFGYGKLSSAWFTSLLFFVLGMTGGSLSAQSADVDSLPFDVFGEAIDGLEIYKHFVKATVSLEGQDVYENAEQLLGELRESKTSSEISRDRLRSNRVEKRDEVYRHMVKSSLVVGVLYDCGRCDKSHPSFAGGVMVSEDGKFLTNHHVVKSFLTRANHEGMFAMTSDGNCFQLDRILAANKKADVALVQLKAKGHKFYSAAIAEKRPSPMEVVRVMSNPSMQFFVMTKGEVSRYVTSSSMGTRMEITASYGAGSSGSGVFNDRGEVVGLVSSNRPLLRSTKGQSVGTDELEAVTASKNVKTMYPEIILRRCTTHKAITDCFRK